MRRATHKRPSRAGGAAHAGAILPWILTMFVGKTMPCLPPMTGNGLFIPPIN